MNTNNELVNLYPIAINVHSVDEKIFQTNSQKVIKLFDDCAIPDSKFMTTETDWQNENAVSGGNNIFRKKDLYDFVGTYVIPEVILDYTISLSVKLPQNMSFSRICKLKKGEIKTFRDLGSAFSVFIPFQCSENQAITFINPNSFFESEKIFPEKLNSFNSTKISFDMTGKMFCYPSYSHYEINALDDVLFAQLGFTYG